MAKSIGIDLGTANVIVNVNGRGIVLNEPAVVAIDKKSEEVVAIGSAAYDMIGRTPDSIAVVRPIRDGVIADFDLAEIMLKLLLAKINVYSFLSRPNILISCPMNMSEVERLALVEAVERIGSSRIYIEEEPKMAGFGAGIDPFDPKGAMVIDIGAGTTDIAILANGEVHEGYSSKIAGDYIDRLISHYFRDQHQLLVGEISIEQTKKAIASALEISASELLTFDVKGRDLLTGLPKSVNVHSNQLVLAIRPAIKEIARAAKRVLETATPEIAGDIVERGIVLTGGGALMYQLDAYLSEYLQVSVIRAEQPLNCVAIGNGIMLDLILSGKLERTNPTFKQKIKRLLMRWKRRLMG